jgi:hypothetical protein
MSKFLLNLLVQISKALVNSKIQFLIQKFFFLTFGPADLAAHSAFGPASPLASPLLWAEAHKPAQAAQPACRWHNCGSTFSLLICTFQAGRLPLVSLTSGAEPSVLSSSHAGRSLPLSPIASVHPAPPDLRPRDAR